MISFLLEKKIILSLYLYTYKWFQIALYCNIFLYFFLQYFFSNTNLWQSTGLKKKKVFTYEDSFKDPLFSLNKLHVLEHNRQAIFW